MSHILSSKFAYSASSRPKIVELAKGFLVNGHYYTKNTLSPVPFEAMQFGGSRYELLINKHLHLETFSWSEPSNELGIIQDSNDKNKFYIFTSNGYKEGTRGYGILIEKEKNNVVEKITSVSIGDIQIMKLVDQDDKYLYFTCRGNKITYLYRFDKTANTFASSHTTSTYTYNLPYMEKLYSDETYIYTFTQLDNNYIVYQYNKTTNTCLYTSNIKSGVEKTYYTTRFNTPIHVENKKYGFYAFNPVDLTQPIVVYAYDTSIPIVTSNTDNGAFTATPVNITWNNEIDSVKKLVTNSVYSIYQTDILEINNKRYLNLFVYNQAYESVDNAAVQGIYTFLIKSTYELEFKGFAPCDTANQFGGFITNENKRQLILAKQNAFQIMRFDTNIEKYVDAGFDITDCISVGFDELYRIWYERTDTSVHIINLSDAQSVQIKFEKTYYEYSGTTINTYIEFSALNYLNEDMEGTFHLLMTGSAVFADNNTSELTFYYNGTGKQQIPINITGANPITIYPKYVVEE